VWTAFVNEPGNCGNGFIHQHIIDSDAKNDDTLAHGVGQPFLVRL
jgi:hypothetical protein